jgi:hypothetical protein
VGVSLYDARQKIVAASKEAAEGVVRSSVGSDVGTVYLKAWRAALERAADVSHELGDVLDHEISAIADSVCSHLPGKPK